MLHSGLVSCPRNSPVTAFRFATRLNKLFKTPAREPATLLDAETEPRRPNRIDGGVPRPFSCYSIISVKSLLTD
jgi:hypothetical protein